MAKHKKKTNQSIPILSRGTAGGDTSLATSAWLAGEEVTALAKDVGSAFSYSRRPRRERPRDQGSLFLGRSEADGGGEPLGWCDDRHVVTVAGSRAGKGRSAIIPNLRLYPGPIVCIDPKGENAVETAEKRARELGHEVHVLDPYGTTDSLDPSLLSFFDPIAVLDPQDPEVIELIGVLADSIVVSSGGQDAHWDDTSRAFIGALIGHVATAPLLALPRTLSTVRVLLTSGDLAAAERFTKAAIDAAIAEEEETYDEVKPFEALLMTMCANEELDGMIAGQANRLNSMSAAERGSVLSTSDRHTKFLEGSRMSSVLSKSIGRKRLDLAKLKNSKTPIAIYLCLPTRYFATHSRWLRLMINAIMGAVEKKREEPACGYRILAILDEFPVLGYLRSIESAIGYMAGYGLQIWAILQDLSQLKRDYPQTWETFLGNAGLKQFFGNADLTTLDYISKSLGQTEVARTTMSWSTPSESDREMAARRQDGIDYGKGKFETQQEIEQVVCSALMTADEIARTFHREAGNQILLVQGQYPIFAFRRNIEDLDASGELQLLLRDR